VTLISTYKSELSFQVFKCSKFSKVRQILNNVTAYAEHSRNAMRYARYGSIPRPGDSEKVFTFFTRKDSCSFNLSVVPGVVKIDEQVHFVLNVLNVPREHIREIHLHSVRKFLLVQVKDVAMDDLVAKAEAGVIMLQTGSPLAIPMAMYALSHMSRLRGGTLCPSSLY
jgi:hypothetical protein